LDKALALIGGENGRQVWDDVFYRSKGLICQVHNDKPYYPEDWKSDILPQYYTRASKDDPSVDRNTENKCWNEAGLRFNELRQLVKIDRAAYPEFKIKWLRHARDNMKDKDGINVEEDANNKVVKADDDFNEGTTTTHPVLNKAKQQDGIHSGDDTDEEEEEEGEEGGEE
jgi:hypothetical protein